MADRGTVTFLFTDIEGSTRLLKQLRDGYGEVLEQHRDIIRNAFQRRGGEEVDTQGDSFFYVFHRARDAANAAADAQRALAAHAWPEGAEFRIRIGIHTGEPNVSDDGRFTGLGVHRTARIMAAGHGGQILMSQATASVLDDDEPAGMAVRDLGAHMLKDLDKPERIYQLDVDGLPHTFPSLRTLDPVSRARRPPWSSAFWTGRRRVFGTAGLALVVALVLIVSIVVPAEGLSHVDANALGVIDAASGKIVKEIPVGASPTDIAVGEGGIWVVNADDHTVTHLDAAKKTIVGKIDLDSIPGGITTGGGFVWVTNSLAGSVSKIDPKLDKVVQLIAVGNGPRGILFAAGSIWVANTQDDTISRIDATSGRTTKTLHIGATELTSGAGSVWASQRTSNSVARIDPASNGVVDRISVGNGPTAIAFAAGSAWVANTLDGTVSRIATDTDSVAQTIQTGNGPTGIAAGSRSVWVTNEFDGTVVRIDATRGTIASRLRVRNRPQQVAIDGNLVLVSVRESGARHRGGTLTVRLSSGRRVDSIDPAIAYISTSWSILHMAYDGLVGFNQASGLEGTQLVPDLAVSLPSPTDDGRTYGFHLRPGLKYSDGSPVKASDVRASMERLFKVGSLPVQYYDHIVGADACKRKPQSCDLSRGILTDDSSRTITFHLTKTDPEFLYKLAIPFAYVVPAASPPRDTDVHPLTGTGPYAITTFEPDKVVKLTRNPRFREWSKAAQPAGYPDTIVFQNGGSPDDAFDDVLNGSADIASTFNAGIPGADTLTKIQTRYASQVRSNALQRTFSFFLNTKVAPFDDVRVRRALNYAIDRSAAVRIAGGSAIAQATCQILPPFFPGYRPYCPYTAGSTEDGTWKAPDIQRARKLIAQSGTSGMRVTFWSYADASEWGPFAAKLLRSLGYRVSVKVIGDDYFGKAFDTANRAQIGFFPWTSDYPAASGFFTSVLTCHSIAKDSPVNLNPAQFCDRSVDAKIDHALSVQSINPGASRDSWETVDRDTVDQAPWVPFVNGRAFDVVSSRVGNYQFSPAWAVLLDQLWLR